MSKLKVFTAFSGYDSQMLALRRAGIDCDLVGWSEIDKYAIQAHDILFPEYKNRNHGDIKEIDWGRVADFDLFTYSSPCQDFSIAGNHQGGEKGSGTRSSLLWECERAIKAKKPKYLLFENVPAVTWKDNVRMFERWCKVLERMGYRNYWKLLTASDYNVPQERTRLIMVSILGGGSFKFPETRKLTKTIDGILDKGRIDMRKFGINDRVKERQIEKCLRERKGEIPKKGAYVISYSRDDYGNIINYHPKPVANTLTATTRTSTAMYVNTGKVIRHFTPTERLRLMGLSDREVKILEGTGISDTQLNKLAGNSIVVDVLEAVFREVFKGGKSKSETLGDLGGYNDFWYRTVNVYSRYFKGLKLLINKLEYDKKAGRFELYIIKGNVLYDHTTTPNTPEAKRDIRQYIDRIDKTMDVEWISDKKYRAPSKTPGRYVDVIFSLFEKAAQIGAKNRDMHRALCFKERYRELGLTWPGTKSIIDCRGNTATLRNKERELGLEHKGWYSWDMEQEKTTTRQVRL